MLHSGDYNNPTERLYKVVDDIIYQSTYQWFGNAVTPSWWTDTWMNGGIAAYLKYYIIDKVKFEFTNTHCISFIFINII